MHDLQGEVAGHVPIVPQLDVPELLPVLLHTLAHCLPHHLPGAWQGTPRPADAHTSWLENSMSGQAMERDQGHSHRAHQRGGGGTAGITAPVSNNITAQMSSVKEETWAGRAGKACNPPMALSLIQHQLCTLGWREGCATEARWPHDAVGRELGSVGAAGSRASSGMDGAPTAAHKTSSVLPSRSRNWLAAGQQLWPQASR